MVKKSPSTYVVSYVTDTLVATVVALLSRFIAAVSEQDFPMVFMMIVDRRVLSLRCLVLSAERAHMVVVLTALLLPAPYCHRTAASAAAGCALLLVHSGWDSIRNFKP